MEKHITYKENPFLDKLRFREGIRVSKIADIDHLKLYDTNSNKVNKDVNVVYAKEVTFDKTEFIKLYECDLMFLNDLSKLGIRVFTYLLKYKVEYNRDTVVINIGEMIDSLGYKPSARKEFKKAIDELLDLDVFAKTVDTNIYFLNPRICYKGERRYLLFDKQDTK